MAMVPGQVVEIDGDADRYPYLNDISITPVQAYAMVGKTWPAERVRGTAFTSDFMDGRGNQGTYVDVFWWSGNTAESETYMIYRGYADRGYMRTRQQPVRQSRKN